MSQIANIDQSGYEQQRNYGYASCHRLVSQIEALVGITDPHLMLQQRQLLAELKLQLNLLAQLDGKEESRLAHYAHMEKPKP